MRILFIENDDSFSWNVIDTLPFEREALTLIRGRQVALSEVPLAGYQALVIGPGPMDPLRVGLVEIVRRAAQRQLPTLGVCLGHQALGLGFGARLVRASPVHGKTSVVTFRDARWFGSEAGPRAVMRYHSLALTDVSAPLRTVATAEDGTVMAIEHESLPMAGVQFHPDSYASERGRELFAGFFQTTLRRG